MAPKKTEKMENPSMVVSSSEEEEEEVSGSSDDESGEDEEQISKGSEENKPKDSSSKTLKTPSTAIKQSSDSDSGSEADSDSEAEPSPKATAVSPVKSKQKETAVKSGMKRASEGTSTDVKSKQKESNDSPAVKSGMKRASEVTSTDVNAKKAKTVSASGEENIKAYFQRPSKRTTNPGVRVIGGRIYDSSNGKTCHQCRQKTMDFVASCKAMNKNKTCPINYCHKCLINRYGENAEEVAKLDNWICPKCRGNCNCSFCMKKRGLNPTGILTLKAKASGLSSVSQLLEIEGTDKFTYQKKLKLVLKRTEDFVEVADVAKENKKVVGKNKRKLKEETQFEAENVVMEEKKVVGKSKRKVKEDIQFEAKPQDVTMEMRKVKEEIEFEKSFLVGSIMSFGVDEQSVKQRWSKVPVETKKGIEEKLKLVQAKEFELMMLKTDVLSDATSVISEAI